MNHSFITIGLIVAALVPLACSPPNDRQASASPAAYRTKSSRGDISFDLTPRVTDDGQLVVDLGANTHSGDLADLDLEALVSLVVDGESRRPVAATALGGHHSTGTVTFDADPPRIASRS